MTRRRSFPRCSLRSYRIFHQRIWPMCRSSSFLSLGFLSLGFLSLAFLSSALLATASAAPAESDDVLEDVMSAVSIVCKQTKQNLLSGAMLLPLCPRNQVRRPMQTENGQVEWRNVAVFGALLVPAGIFGAGLYAGNGLAVVVGLVAFLAVAWRYANPSIRAPHAAPDNESNPATGSAIIPGTHTDSQGRYQYTTRV